MKYVNSMSELTWSNGIMENFTIMCVLIEDELRSVFVYRPSPNTFVGVTTAEFSKRVADFLMPPELPSQHLFTEEGVSGCPAVLLTGTNKLPTMIHMYASKGNDDEEDKFALFSASGDVVKISKDEVLEILAAISKYEDG